MKCPKCSSKTLVIDSRPQGPLVKCVRRIVRAFGAQNIVWRRRECKHPTYKHRFFTIELTAIDFNLLSAPIIREETRAYKEGSLSDNAFGDKK